MVKLLRHRFRANRALESRDTKQTKPPRHGLMDIGLNKTGGFVGCMCVMERVERGVFVVIIVLVVERFNIIARGMFHISACCESCPTAPGSLV